MEVTTPEIRQHLVDEDGQPLPVLLVEDDDAAAQVIARGVEALGLKVQRARNGEEAILITQNNLPALVLMDLMMPRLDGLETSRYLKLRYEGYLPILVVTARDDRESLERAELASVDDYLTKPVRFQVLREAAMRLLALRHLEDRVAEPEAAPEVRQALVNARMELAQDLESRGRVQLAAIHLRRLAELIPDDPRVIEMKRRLGG